MDRLGLLLRRFSLSAGVFYSGQLCGVHDFAPDLRRGHVHLVKRGPVELRGGVGGTVLIDRPTLVFMPRPDTHMLRADDREGAEVVCATIQFGAGGANPVSDSLPAVVLIQLDDFPGTRTLLELMYDEAFTERGGRQAVLDRLCEVLMIHLLRYCMVHGLTQGGTLAALADSRLAKAVTAMHDDPARNWDLPEMAQMAGMSRARFAAHFREVTGATPADYLAAWRITLAQSMLAAGRPLKIVASEVGYGSPSALTRAFSRKVGQAPSAWMRAQQDAAPAPIG